MRVYAGDETRRVIWVERFSENFFGIDGDGVGDVKDLALAKIEVGSDLRIEIWGDIAKAWSVKRWETGMSAR